MKQTQNGSVHVILLGVVVILISGTLTYSLLKALGHKLNAQSVTQQSKSTEPIKQQSNQTAGHTDKAGDTTNLTYAEFSEWKVRFPTSTKYTLKRNSGTGNMAAYFISNDSLIQACANPSTPWLGIIRQLTPSDVIESGPDAGKTFEQKYKDQGETINGKLYVYNISSQYCTRGASNTLVEKAAKQLESEIKLLEAY